MLLFFRDKLNKSGGGQATFSRGELSLLLGVYGERVQRGEWRDYAIDHLQDMAVFSVFRSSKEAPIYSIAKIPSRSILRPSQFAVYSGKETLKQSASLNDILEFLKELA
jgi:hypothetical protein